ncbi:hypothetical protein CJ030_MR5G017204 [Morella rubra]|uniref:Uncharacterized protein n=1 Tax=Morella rubra TaxID=262757 RepID=A0A6A1VM20_9ROSI|nr:hypothetical protein CJ030_MR5G017204 [Morella rubra]
MAPRADLVKTGLEGFNLLEEYYDARTRRPGGKQQVPKGSPVPASINSKEAAIRYAGILVEEHHNAKEKRGFVGLKH